MTDPSSIIAGLSEAEEICECGDFHSHHPGDGPCLFNGRGFDLCHGGRDCLAYRPALLSQDKSSGGAA